MIAPVAPVLLDGIDDGPAVSCLADEDGFDDEEEAPPPAAAADLEERLLRRQPPPTGTLRRVPPRVQ